ncbi:MAG: hypothetical protein HY748_14870 [Elusimicrobia bacterium]|nr:hypothetical protein [Elusimicrobiota bacterium]
MAPVVWYNLVVMENSAAGAALCALLAACVLGTGARASPAAQPPKARTAKAPGDAALLAPLMQMVMKKGMDDITFKGGLAAVLGVPDPTRTKTEIRSARKSTDGWRHLCSVTLTPAPAEIIFWANRKVGHVNEDFYARVSPDGRLLKAIVREDKPDENGHVVRGAAKPLELDVKSQEAKVRARHELDLWLFGDSLKPKQVKKHLKRLAPFQKKAAAEQTAPEAEEGPATEEDGVSGK